MWGGKEGGGGEEEREGTGIGKFFKIKNMKKKKTYCVLLFILYTGTH